jgi:hypothetical protein
MVWRLRDWLDEKGFGARFPAEAVYPSFLNTIHTSYETHPAQCATGALTPGVNWSGREACRSLPISTEELYFQSPHTS